MAAVQKGKGLVTEINVVPYIDVMLVLLVIFVITAPLMMEGVRLDLPDTEAEQMKKDEKRLVVSVDPEGAINVENIDGNIPMASLAELEDHARLVLRLRPDIQVLVRGDKTASYGDVAGVLATLQEAGALSLGLITDPAEGK
ncbi:MAG: ExbD/TolR family protein [Gammaproteobacteria bacterium AqS3]|nr:ExbD/TolR family protein [Gammaproteobacteria bacterium AqS3]